MPHCLCGLLEPLFLDGRAGQSTFIEGEFVRGVVLLVCWAALVGILHEPVDHCVTPRFRTVGLLHCSATLVGDGPCIKHWLLYPTTDAVPLRSVAAACHHHVRDALVCLHSCRVAVSVDDLQNHFCLCVWLACLVCRFRILYTPQTEVSICILIVGRCFPPFGGSFPISRNSPWVIKTNI